MLIEYSVENYRSIADKITISMVPSRERLKSRYLISVEGNPNIKKLLKSVAIYGANASGKTNIIRALKTMRDIVVFSKGKNSGDKFSEYLPFDLDDYHPLQPTVFEIHFITRNQEYKYLFSYDNANIITEELYYFKNKKEFPFFKRNKEDFEPFVDREELTKLFQNTGKNVLFLSKANNEYKKFGPIFEWFNNYLSTVGPVSGVIFKNALDFMNQSDEHKKIIMNLIHSADLDIFDISGETIEFKLGSETKDKFADIFSTIITEISQKTPSIKKPESTDIQEFKNALDLPRFGFTQIPDVKSIRKKIDGESTITHEFLGYESAGTTQFFNMIGLWMIALYNENKILVIDEFDSHLHPDLQVFLIRLFQDPEINKQNSQLIFTAHNTRLLAVDLFRRDQILITEKNPKTKSTEIIPLFDYEKRQDRSIERNYFFGRYGGIPDITYGKI